MMCQDLQNDRIAYPLGKQTPWVQFSRVFFFRMCWSYVNQLNQHERMEKDHARNISIQSYWEADAFVFLKLGNFSEALPAQILTLSQYGDVSAPSTIFFYTLLFSSNFSTEAVWIMVTRKLAKMINTNTLITPHLSITTH